MKARYFFSILSMFMIPCLPLAATAASGDSYTLDSIDTPYLKDTGRIVDINRDDQIKAKLCEFALPEIARIASQYSLRIKLTVDACVDAVDFQYSMLYGDHSKYATYLYRMNALVVPGKDVCGNGIYDGDKSVVCEISVDQPAKCNLSTAEDVHKYVGSGC